MIGMSVIICCYNSETRLPETIKHLAKQKRVNNIKWEIVIVDNLSTDNTALIAVSDWGKYNINDVGFRVVSETKQGLSYARQKGVESANFEYILFCDDDNWLEENYLDKSFHLINNNLKIGAIGGQSVAVSDANFPEWFEEYKGGYAIGKQNNCSGNITSRGFVWGAGLVTRKRLFLQTINDNYPSLLTGRKENQLSSGDDYEYCLRIIMQDFTLYYSEDLIFKHFIQKNRLTENYRTNLFKSFDISGECLIKYVEALKIKNSSKYTKLKLFFSALKDFVKSIIVKRKPMFLSSLIMFYFLNIGFNNDEEYKTIKHFYDL